jgi:transposase
MKCFAGEHMCVGEIPHCPPAAPFSNRQCGKRREEPRRRPALLVGAFGELGPEPVGLYLEPPDRALVLCIDEKSQIQALDRTQPLLPMRPGQVERRTHDYKRHGTTSLFAALDVKVGTIIGKCMPRRRFLDTVEKNAPVDLDIHIIMDNASSHQTKLIRDDWFAKRPNWHAHFTPTSAS